MNLKIVTVFVEYRMISSGIPQDKRLRARVRADDGTFGTNLVQPNYRNVDDLIGRCMLALPYCEHVYFEFHPLIGLPTRIYTPQSMTPINRDKMSA